MLSLLSIIICIVALVGFILIYSSYQYYFKPRNLIQFYKQQGLDMFFSFGTGIHDRDYHNSIENNDYALYEKEVVSKNLHTRAWGGNLGKYVVLNLFDPQLIKDFTQIQAQHYKKAKMYDIIRMAADRGLVFSEGERWKMHKKIVSSVFHFEFLRQMVPQVVETTLTHFNDLKEANLLNARNEFEMITGELVGRIFFGGDFSKYKIEGVSLTIFLKEITTEGWGLSWSLSNLLLGSEFVKMKIMPEHKRILGRANQFRNFCNERVKERMQVVLKDKTKLRNNSLLDQLILSTIENPNFTEEDITDEFATFCAAGMDTTGHTIAMCTYYYLQNPEYHEKLHKEINIYLSNSKEITYESIGKMEFTQAWIMETLRLGAPTFRTFMREALDDHVIGDIKIKKGTLIDLSFFPNNYSEVYHDEPMKFNPERWLDPKSKSRLSMLKDPFCFVPFSCGPRICVGQHLAILETKVIFGLFVKKFEFKLDPEYKFAMATRFLYEPRDDLIFTLHKRVDLSK